MSYTAVHIPEFPAAAWLRGSPRLRAQPVAVLKGVPPQETIASLNPRARAAGIEHGMSRAQAETICPVLFQMRQIDQEQVAFAAALEIAERFSPRVESVASPANSYGGGTQFAAALMLDSHGTGTLFGPIESYVQKLRTRFAAGGFTACIGAAPNAEAALLLARSGRSTVCTDPRDLREKLAPLPASLLACEPKVQAVLARWGIRALGQLAELPEAALVSRLGQSGQRLRQLARGEAEYLLVPEEPAFRLSETVSLEAPVTLLDSLLFVLSPMLEAVLGKARDRAYALRTVRLTLALEGGAGHSVRVGPALPTTSRELLLKLLNLELQTRPPPAGITGVTLEAEAAEPQTAQRGLFQTQFPAPDSLDLLLARLRKLAGQRNVGSPVLGNSHREEDFSLADFQPRVRPPAKRNQVDEHHGSLALRMFRPAQPVRVASAQGRPCTLEWQGARLLVANAAGPWHTSGSWWNGQAWDNDFWDVMTAGSTQALRLEHTAQGWFVAGVYD